MPRDRRNMARLLLALGELPYGLARELDADELARNPVTIVGDDPRVDVLTVAWTVTFDARIPKTGCPAHTGALECRFWP